MKTMWEKTVLENNICIKSANALILSQYDLENL